MNISAVTKILEGAQCKEIEGRKCFVVSLAEFGDLADRFDGQIRSDRILTNTHGLENFELRLSSLEEGTYFVCAKSEPALDALWNKKFKP
jgi:hypothetical protein